MRNVFQLSEADTRRAIEHIGRYPRVFMKGRVKRLSNWSSPTSFFVRHLASGQYDRVAALHGVLGGKQEHVVCCDSVKSINPNTTEVGLDLLSPGRAPRHG